MLHLLSSFLEKDLIVHLRKHIGLSACCSRVIKSSKDINHYKVMIYIFKEEYTHMRNISSILLISEK